jgi:hypothetical protein
MWSTACIVCWERDFTCVMRHVLPCRCKYILCNSCILSVPYCLYCRAVFPGRGVPKRVSEACHTFFIKHQVLLREARHEVVRLRHDAQQRPALVVYAFVTGMLVQHMGAWVWGLV